MKVGIKLLDNYDKNWNLPNYKYHGDAGMDIRAAINEDVIIGPGQRAAIPTGVSLEIPEGHEIQVRPRSGLSLKNGITVLNSPGTLDHPFKGEVLVILINLDNSSFVVHRGDRIAQLVLKRFEEIEWSILEDLSNTDRGSGGFGSTGIK